ncbi:MAG: hypothetical protein ACK55Z_20860, partial [bacterium]
MILLHVTASPSLSKSSTEPYQGIVYRTSFATRSLLLVFSSVADLGGLCWISDPNFSIPDQGSKR